MTRRSTLSKMLTIWGAVCACAIATGQPASAQQPRSAAPSKPQPPPAASSTPSTASRELARGWSALGAGRSEEAERASDAVLKIRPRDHDALALKIRARVTGRGSLAALDTYEAWQATAGGREDVFLLETIATGLIQSLTNAPDVRIRSRALELLTALGDGDAAKQLEALAGDAGISDAARARVGDAAAVARLAARVRNGGARDVSAAIDALRDSDSKTTSADVAAALDPSRPLPTRMAAARALGTFGDQRVVPQLQQALKDPDFPVQIMAAAALARLGDPSAQDLIQKYAGSPVGDLRLMAIEAGAEGDPTGPWVGVATGVLQDPDPLVRLRAAELLLAHAADPGPAVDVFADALADPSPAMRYAAAQRLDRLPSAALDRDVPGLRKLLRDPSLLIQLEGAAGILRLSGAIP